MRIGVLASGSGTILQSLLDAGLPIAVVIVDRPCAATGRAEAAGVPAVVVSRTSFGADFDRVAYTHDVVDELARHEVDLVAMAGFGTILEKPVHDAYPDRIVNTHPALLPAFPGATAVADALEYGARWTGATVHFVDDGLDSGEVILQEPVPIADDDTVESLREKIQAVEHVLLPEACRLALGGKLQLAAGSRRVRIAP